MNSYAVIVPNRYEDVIKPLQVSIHHHIPEPKPRILIIANFHDRDYGFEAVKYPPIGFVYAKAVNMGIRAAGIDDVILLNDDCIVLVPDFFNELRKWAYQVEQVGILSPMIKGGVGNPYQYWYDKPKYWKHDEKIKAVLTPAPVCFPCVYLKRKMIDQIGPLNESFIKYGGEDNEYCDRARAAGWKAAVTSQLTIQHGDGGPELNTGRGKTWSTSFARLD